MNLRMKLAAVVVMTLAIIGVGRRADASPIQFAGNGHYYEFITASVNWFQALAAADAATFDPPGPGLALDGYLVTITSLEEHNFVAALVPAGPPDPPGVTQAFWLAGSDAVSEGTWVWQAGPENGMAFTYFNWGLGEPNDCCAGEDYLEMFRHHGDGRWNDLHATDTFNYVVEYSAAAVPDSPMSAGLLLLAFASLMIFHRGLR